MRQLHDAPAVMRHHASGGFSMGTASMDPSFPMNPVKCEPVDASQFKYGQGGISPMYPGVVSPVPRMADYPPIKPQLSPSPSSLAPVSPMAQQQPHIMVPSSSPALSAAMSSQRTPPVGAMASPGSFPVSLVVVGDQNIYNLQAPIRRDVSQVNQICVGATSAAANVCTTNPFGGQHQVGQNVHQTPMQMEGGAMGVNQQNFSMELSLGNLDSADLSGMGLSEGNMALFDANLSENLSSHLTLSDAEGVPRASSQVCGLSQPVQQTGYPQEMLHHPENVAGAQVKERRAPLERTAGDGAVGGPVVHNMTDSFTSQIKSTLEDICTLNDMYKGTSNGGVDRS